jgi:hypothetical protein
MQRIQNFSHIVPVQKIDIRVGTMAPKLSDPERDRTTTVPISGDIRPTGKAIRTRTPQETAPIRTLSRDVGVVLDVYA